MTTTQSSPRHDCLRIDTAVEATDEDVFSARVSRNWDHVWGVNGGYLASIAVRAAAASIAPLEATSASVSFLNALSVADESEATVEVATSIRRATSRAGCVTFRLVHEGTDVLEGFLWATSASGTGPAIDGASPEPPPPQTIPLLTDRMRGKEQFLMPWETAFQMRPLVWHGDDFESRPAGKPKYDVWFSFSEDHSDPALDLCELLIVGDVFPVLALTHSLPGGAVPPRTSTLQLSATRASRATASGERFARASVPFADGTGCLGRTDISDQSGIAIGAAAATYLMR